MNIDAYLKVLIACILFKSNAQQHVLVVKTAAERKRINAKFRQLVFDIPKWLRTDIVVDTQRCIRFECGSELLIILNERELQGRSPTSVACLDTLDSADFDKYNLKDIKIITEEYA